MEAVKGRIPVADNISSAKTWTPTDGDHPYVPRPDINLETLKGWSLIGGLFGLDHFYMRSPFTGIAKLLTFGGFGFWYLWDIIQLYAEEDRVINYGLSTPFDAVTGIAQGMITDQDTNYKQKSSYSAWIFGALFGFLGVDSAMLGKWAQMIRKLFDAGVFAGILSGIFLTISALSQSITAWNVIGLIFLLVLAGIYGTFVWMPWWLIMSSTVIDPKKMFTKGVTVDSKTDQFLNYFKMWTNRIGPTTSERVSIDFGYGDIKPEELREKFSIYWDNPTPEEGEKASTEKVEPMTWPMSLLLGPIFGFIPALISRIYIINPIEALNQAAVAEANAENSGKSNLLGSIQQATLNQGGGGARKEELSIEAQVMAATVVALIAGGSLKGLVDYLMVE